jgi:hypothetical protein
MTTESREPTLADVINRLDRIDTDIQAVRGRMDTFESKLSDFDLKLDKTDIKFDAYVKASDRMLGVATTIIITAGTVTIWTYSGKI